MPVVYFDLDGVLIDSHDAIGACVNAALEAYGLEPVSDRALHALIGPPLVHGFAALLGERGLDAALADGLVRAYRTRYGAVSLERTRLMPGIAEALPRLSASYRLAIATSKPLRFAEPILERLDVRSHFEGVFAPGPDTDGESKTATLERAIAAMQGGERSRAAATMVGDRHHDIDAARAHGLTSIGVTWGSGTREELETAGAGRVVETVGELERALRDGPS